MNQIKVLVVDDSKPDAILLAKELQRAGYSVVTKRVDTPEDMERELDAAEREQGKARD